MWNTRLSEYVLFNVVNIPRIEHYFIFFSFFRDPGSFLLSFDAPFLAYFKSVKKNPRSF